MSPSRSGLLKNRDMPAWLQASTCSSSALAVSATMGSAAQPGRLVASQRRYSADASGPLRWGMSISKRATSNWFAASASPPPKLAMSAFNAALPSPTPVTAKPLRERRRVSRRRFRTWSSATRTRIRRRGAGWSSRVFLLAAAAGAVAATVSSIDSASACASASPAASAACWRWTADHSTASNAAASDSSAKAVRVDAVSGSTTGRGSSSLNVAPSSMAVRTVRAPPMRFAKARLRNRPSPVPPP